MERKLKIKLDKKFMNIGISINNNLIADTNDSNNFMELKISLPKGKWKIYNISPSNNITLIDNN